MLYGSKKTTAEEQYAVRKLVEDLSMKPKTKLSRNLIKRSKTMWKIKATEKTTEVPEAEQKKQEEKVEEQPAAEEKPVEEEQKEVVEEETIKEEPKTETPEVQEVEPVGNGVRVEDLVTKDELMERLSAFEAKFDALVKENTDLKDKLAKSQEETNDLKDKYENKDFGNISRQGVIEKDKYANETFDNYAKQFL